MKVLITSILFICLISIAGKSNAQPKGEKTQEEVRKNYLEVLSQYETVVCPTGCKLVGGVECWCQNTGVFSQEDDINLERNRDSLKNLGNILAGLVSRINEREQKLKNDLSELELMKSNAMTAMQMIPIILSQSKFIRPEEKYKKSNK